MKLITRLILPFLLLPITGLGQTDDPYASSIGSWGQSFPDQWALQQLNLDAIPATDLLPVTVAVIDTGIDFLHPDLNAQNIWRNPSETLNGKDDDGNGHVDDLIGWNFVEGDNNPWDHSGHGTHISGIIAADTNNGIGIAGINPAARIMVLKVANFAGNARSSAVAAAVYYAVDMGAKIINLSLAGFSISQAEREAINYALKRDILVVAAAGNRATDTQGFGYGSIPGVLTVVATGRDNQRTLFSNFGVDAQIAAPGVDILSLRAHNSDFILLTQPENYLAGGAIVGVDNAYYRASGTSFATAIVTGVASRLLAAQPGLSANQLRHKLQQSATDLDTPGVDQLTGYGLINPPAAATWQPDRYIEARIRSAQVAMSQAEKVVIRITGDADADRFKQARLDIASAANPAHWLPLSETINRPVTNRQLAEIELERLIKLTPGNYRWILRLVSEHADGSNRESRFVLTLPVPQDSAEIAGREKP